MVGPVAGAKGPGSERIRVSDAYAIDPAAAAAMLDAVLAARGPWATGAPVRPDLLAAAGGRVPGLLTALWGRLGEGTLADGRLRLVAPGRFAAVLDWLFADEPDMAGACTAFAHSAFGDILAWHDAHGPVWISPVNGAMTAPGLVHPDRRGDPNLELHDRALMADPAAFDLCDADLVPIYHRARARLGPLGPTMIYGVLPVPPRPEDRSLDRLRLVQAEDWAGEVVTALTITLHDIDDGRFNLRGFGGIRWD